MRYSPIIGHILNQLSTVPTLQPCFPNHLKPSGNYMYHLLISNSVMAKEASCRPLTAEARVCPRAIRVGFIVNRVALGQVFLRVLLFPCQYCNVLGFFYSRWKFITLKVQYTTLDYSSQLF
jgi:hypothetical protein